MHNEITKCTSLSRKSKKCSKIKNQELLQKRNLRWEAGKAIARGLDADAALVKHTSFAFTSHIRGSPRVSPRISPRISSWISSCIPFRISLRYIFDAHLSVSRLSHLCIQSFLSSVIYFSPFLFISRLTSTIFISSVIYISSLPLLVVYLSSSFISPCLSCLY